MRITCEVQVNNRKLPSLNMAPKKNTRSSLSLGRPPGSTADVVNLFIHLCTSQDKRGTKYRVSDNMEGVFTKFIKEGKFTLRFKEPSHDLCVKADPVLAQSFLKTLKLGLQNKDISKMHLTNLTPAKQSQVEKPKTKLIIEHKKNYPITTSFPYSLESLKVTLVDLNRVENRILRLKKLRILDLSHNIIRSLPVTLSEMQVLTELFLSHNKIERIDQGVFTGNITKTLRLLDLSFNEITVLPHTLLRVTGLVNLNLESNKIQRLPVNLGGRLKKLRFLSVANNKLTELPATLMHLRLESLNVCTNPYSTPLGLISDKMYNIPSLKEITSAFCMKRGMRLTAADIPATLVKYVNSYLACRCGKLCYESHILACIPINVRVIAHTVSTSHSTFFPALTTFCSRSCLKKYSLRLTLI